MLALRYNEFIPSVNVITCSYSDLDSMTLKNIYKLRKQSFIDRRKWDIDSYLGGEEERDDYDNLESIYIYSFENSEITGCVRLRPSMVQTLFSGPLRSVRPDHYEKKCVDTWEASRFCISRSAEVASFRPLCGLDVRTISIFMAMINFGLDNAVPQYEAAVDASMFRILRLSGWKMRTLNVERSAFKNPILYVHLYCSQLSLDALARKLRR